MASFPSFYDPRRIGTLFHPDATAIAAQAETAGLPPAEQDSREVMLLVIDMQADFCHPQGSLYVPGAMADIQRLIEFIYRNAEKLTRITCSLDSHYPFQIFHPAWWVDSSGNHPAPFTLIATEDVESRRWRPVFQPAWSLEYVQRLHREAKKQLTIWPYHVPIGGVGNALDPELWSAVFWHSLARRSQPVWWVKGGNPLTEHYSILRPEIAVSDEPPDKPSQDFIRSVEELDALLIAGEAESHCVLETVEDLVEALRDRPDQMAKIRILLDCTSPVRHPQIDFHEIAVSRFKDFEKLGLRLTTSEEPI
jgi:nicotinamidase-related amidase